MDDLWKKSVLTGLLAKYNKKIKSSLSQNYLVEPYYLDRIADCTSDLLSLGETATKRKLVEIGPGLGSLTQALLNRELPLTAVEIDPVSVRILEEVFSKFIKSNQLRVVHQDVLSWIPCHSAHWILVGNLPYHISSQIIFRLCEIWSSYTIRAIFMVQKEMAERIRSEVNRKSYGLLSVMVGYFFSIKKRWSVAPGSFYPAPKVSSEVIEFSPINRKLEGRPVADDYTFFKRLVKAAFLSRRKKILNSVENYFNQPELKKSYSFQLNIFLSCLRELGLSENFRAENLTVDEYVKLSNFYLEKANQK